jgi:hypothetical protein
MSDAAAPTAEEAAQARVLRQAAKEAELGRVLRQASRDWEGEQDDEFWLYLARSAQAGTPHPDPANTYDDPDDPVHGVPRTVLEAAREVLRQAAVWRDVDPEYAEPIADAVVMALLPWFRLHERCGWVGAHQELELGACQELTVGAMGYCQPHLDWHRDRINGDLPESKAGGPDVVP